MRGWVGRVIAGFWFFQEKICEILDGVLCLVVF